MATGRKQRQYYSDFLNQLGGLKSVKPLISPWTDLKAIDLPVKQEMDVRAKVAGP